MSGAAATIGNLDGGHRATVDAHGQVADAGGGWSLEWLVRSTERWHRPRDERGSAVSQRRLGGTPVVETGLRVPGGQVVQRAWCTRAGAAEVVVVEVENRSTVPVAVAIATRGTELAVPRAPSRTAPSVDSLLADGGEEGGTGPVAVFPLAHTATLRVAVPLGARRSVDLASLPGAERVANGWRSHLTAPGTLRVVLPDDAMAERLFEARCELLLATTHDVDALAALDRWGHHDLVRDALTGYPDRRRLGGAEVWSLADHWRFTRDPSVAEATFGAAARWAHRRWRAGGPWRVPGQLAAAVLLDAAGQPEAAARCRELAGSAEAEAEAPLSHPLVDARDALVHERRDELVLAAPWPREWLGQGVEVHEAPTWFGRLSYAVRWHGPRPALLWELERHAGVGAVRLIAPALDPSWSTAEARGEALLAPVGLPTVVAPLAAGSPADTASGAGSFG